VSRARVGERRRGDTTLVLRASKNADGLLNEGKAVCSLRAIASTGRRSKTLMHAVGSRSRLTLSTPIVSLRRQYCGNPNPGQGYANKLAPPARETAEVGLEGGTVRGRLRPPAIPVPRRPQDIRIAGPAANAFLDALTNGAPAGSGVAGRHAQLGPLGRDRLGHRLRASGRGDLENLEGPVPSLPTAALRCSSTYCAGG
jgi:hypothetical protein